MVGKTKTNEITVVLTKGARLFHAKNYLLALHNGEVSDLDSWIQDNMDDIFADARDSVYEALEKEIDDLLVEK